MYKQKFNKKILKRIISVIHQNIYFGVYLPISVAREAIEREILIKAKLAS